MSSLFYQRFIVPTIILITPELALAAGPLLGATSFGEFVEDFYRWSIGAGAALAVIMLIYAGYIMITSAGDPGRTGQAKEIIIGSLSGLLLLAGARLILNLLSAS